MTTIKNQFTPGNNSNASRMINYVSEFNAANLNDINMEIPCNCIPNYVNKTIPSSSTVTSQVSYKTRISQVIQTSKGGKTYYGNFYLGQPLQLNYLGRVEGMSGGSGSPPLNKF